MRPLKPPRLRRGDVIGIVAPASPLLDPARLDRGIRYLEGLGYRVEPGRHLQSRNGFFAGPDTDRATDLNTMAADPRVRAVFCLRGGYGSARLLPRLDYRAFRRDPKILVGFSDLTALQLALWHKVGLVTFSGPLVGVELANPPTSFTEEHFWRLLTSKRKPGLAPHPRARNLKSLKPGVASGRLLPANLALLLSLLGTPFAPNLRDALLVVEDVGEHLHRIDRMFTQLHLAGILRRLAGLVLGTFAHCQNADSRSPRVSLRRVLLDAASNVAGPVATGLAYGHQANRVTLPVGTQAHLDSRHGTLSLTESAVT
jgi:muramoyltetrapeptide carboxypeptidase